MATLAPSAAEQKRMAAAYGWGPRTGAPLQQALAARSPAQLRAQDLAYRQAQQAALMLQLQRQGQVPTLMPQIPGVTGPLTGIPAQSIPPVSMAGDVIDMNTDPRAAAMMQWSAANPGGGAVLSPQATPAAPAVYMGTLGSDYRPMLLEQGTPPRNSLFRQTPRAQANRQALLARIISMFG